MHGTSHGENALRVLQVVLKAVDRKLAGNGIAGTAGSGAVRIAALDHETSDDAVKDQTVIKVFLDQGDKIVYGDRSDFRIELRLDHAAVRHGKSYDWILCHLCISFLKNKIY